MTDKIRNRWWSPVLVTLCLCLGFVALTLVKVEGDILKFIVIGTRFSEGDPQGSEGYDGQFGYYIALDPNPQSVRPHLDVPAYRYQRILLPILARIFSFGNQKLIPYWLVFFPLLGQVLGVAYVAKIISELGQNPFIALVYGLNAGSLLAIRVALPEPLAYGCVAVAIYAYLKKKYWLVAIWILMAFLAKEVTVVFGGAILFSLLIQREWKGSGILAVGSFLPFCIWQIWLWWTFGKMGIGSGGANSTGFEWIPFMGLLRIANYNWIYFLAMLVVFAPLVVIPSVWGAWVSLRELLRSKWDIITLSLFLNSLVMFFLPFSTYRETGGILRLSVGFVLAFLLFVAKGNYSRLLRYLPLWVVYNVFLFR
ncbi:MAG: hypothetical protein N3D16_02455 [Anaerolineales bacterium]|nr:hypothetical protein [Anaerolineales bacterium]